jgi:DNA polymerase III sliding clamp (beta) subunit (PCNA family)
MFISKASLTHHVASTDKTREHLQVLHLSKRGVISTDGYRLLCIPAEANDCSDGDEILLPVDAAKAIAKALPSKGVAEVDLVATRANGHIAIAAGAGTFAPAKGATTYPNVDQIIPQGAASAQVRFDARYMSELCQAMIAAGDNFVSLSLYGDAKGAMRLDGESGAWALLMPTAMPKR